MHIGILEWFKPPERKTLRPLCVVVLVRACGSLCVRETFVNLGTFGLMF
jgi:hypothetical protein